MQPAALLTPDGSWREFTTSDLAITTNPAEPTFHTGPGSSADLETYAFQPHTAQSVRFCGFGNTVNAWNSSVHFRVLAEDAANPP